MASHLDGLAIRAPWVAVSNVDIGTGSVVVTGWDSGRGCYASPTTHVSVRNSVFGTLTVDNVQQLVVEGNSIGNVVSDESEIHDGTVPTCPGNNDLVLRGNTWHDYFNIDGGVTHMECLQLENVENTLLDGNRFQNCGQYDVFVSNGSPDGPVRNLTIRNNYFDAPCSNQQGTGCAALATLSVGPTTPGPNVFVGVQVLFNSFVSYPLLRADPDAVMARNVVAYNVTAGYPDSVHCGYGRWVMTKNMDSGGFTHCGTDFPGRANFVDPAPPVYNLDLVPGSPGINAVRCPPDAPVRDIRGTRRPLQSKARCDVGAFELPAPLPKQGVPHRR